MCEKNLEGKVLSLSSNDDTDEASNNDIEEETIVDDSIDDEMGLEEEIIKPKKRSRKKKPKTKYCKTCYQDILENEIRNMLMFQDTYHQLQAREYCKEHEVAYSNHKCKPHWCGDCNYLVKYDIEVEIQKG